jgi:hypothetical protein
MATKFLFWGVKMHQISEINQPGILSYTERRGADAKITQKCSLLDVALSGGFTFLNPGPWFGYQAASAMCDL